MKYYSTKNKNQLVDLKTAVLQSLPPDNGLYMPEDIPVLDPTFVNNLADHSFVEIAKKVATPYLSADFSAEVIDDIITTAINFPAPLIKLKDSMSVLELWHGPSLAFKDFGARFMAAVMSKLVEGQDQKLTILVATSGDTGGAVAAGFLGVDNVEVIILYPSGKVSPLQEKQLTTLGQNITALEIDGTFDDCQALVKQAFLDERVNRKYMLSSANSINITRLIPQSFYYFEAYKQLNTKDDVYFCVPSGNFGNLTAGLLARKMGLPVSGFIAATNANDVVPRYLAEGEYAPRPSVQTISNAMDVGAPSNFRRMEDLYGHLWTDMAKDISGYAYNDDPTKLAILEIYKKYGYIMDPHGAVGYLAAKDHLRRHRDAHVVILETAHPAKFLPVMTPILGHIDVPTRLDKLRYKEKEATSLPLKYSKFKRWLLDRAI